MSDSATHHDRGVAEPPKLRLGAVETELAARYLAVVGRGKTARFRFLQEHLQGPGFVELIWDRRISERRSTGVMALPERRQGDRRSPLPVTWGALSFLLVPRGGSRA